MRGPGQELPEQVPVAEEAGERGLELELQAQQVPVAKEDGEQGLEQELQA